MSLRFSERLGFRPFRCNCDSSSEYQRRSSARRASYTVQIPFRGVQERSGASNALEPFSQYQWLRLYYRSMSDPDRQLGLICQIVCFFNELRHAAVKNRSDTAALFDRNRLFKNAKSSRGVPSLLSRYAASVVASLLALLPNKPGEGLGGEDG